MAWVPPPDVVAAARARPTARYDGAGPWVGRASCAGDLTPGARALRAYLATRFPGVTSVGALDCRPNTANAALASIHSVGRALDAMVPASSAVGDAVAAWLVRHAADIGVQYLVWDRTAYSPSRAPGARFHPYTGPDSHAGHVHVELDLDGAAMRTAWFQGGGAGRAPESVVAALPGPRATDAPWWLLAGGAAAVVAGVVVARRRGAQRR